MRMRTDGASFFVVLRHESSFQQIFHCAAENTGQTIEGFPSLFIHLNGANGALRVEFSTYLKLYVELRTSQGN